MRCSSAHTALAPGGRRPASLTAARRRSKWPDRQGGGRHTECACYGALLLLAHHELDRGLPNLVVQGVFDRKLQAVLAVVHAFGDPQRVEEDEEVPPPVLAILLGQ